jgi:TetR/AcrR family transcriptional regulator
MNYIAERRQEEKDRRRDQILDAAAVIAEQVGVDEFTMDQVAKKARLSRALIYVYFQDKEDLLFGLADRANKELHARFAAITAKQQTGLKMVQDMGRSYVDYASDAPVYFEAMACFAAHEVGKTEPDENEARCLQACDLVLGELIKGLHIGIQDGSLRRDMGRPEVVALTLWGLMYGIIQLISTKEAILSHIGVSNKQMVENALQLATRGLIADSNPAPKRKK